MLVITRGLELARAGAVRGLTRHISTWCVFWHHNRVGPVEYGVTDDGVIDVATFQIV